jgi:hypothetical protein
MTASNSIGISRTLYPSIVVEADDICRDCLEEAAWEDVDLHQVAVELESELERVQEELIAVWRVRLPLRITSRVVQEEAQYRAHAVARVHPGLSSILKRMGLDWWQPGWSDRLPKGLTSAPFSLALL